MNSFADFVWGFFLLIFWFMIIWIFIQVFADVFRRRDLTGGWKCVWILAIFLVPFLGALVYMLIRPRDLPQDVEDRAKMEEAQRRISGYSPADEIAKLDALKAAGSITQQEYDTLKQRALMTV